VVSISGSLYSAFSENASGYMPLLMGSLPVNNAERLGEHTSMHLNSNGGILFPPLPDGQY
jgi:hypothetical protein